MVPFDQFRICQIGAEREVPHQEQTVSSLPMSCLHLGQSIARDMVILSCLITGRLADFVPSSNIFQSISRPETCRQKKGGGITTDTSTYLQTERGIDTGCIVDFVTVDVLFRGMSGFQ